VFLLALRDVLEARGENIAELAEETQLNKQNLYRMLSKIGFFLIFYCLVIQCLNAFL